MAAPPQIVEGITLHRQGDLAGAEKIYRAILAQDPDHFDALHLLGVIAHQTGKNAIAVDLIRTAIAVKPEEPAAYNNLGTAQRGLNLWADALASFEKAIALQPDFAKAHANRGDALLRLKRHHDALASFDKVLVLSPDSAQAHGKRGSALLGLKRAEEALASFDRALALDPNEPEMLHERGCALIELKRTEEAITSFDRALALGPDYVDALTNRGNALLNLKRLDEALASYDRALALKPGYGAAFSGAAGSALKICDWERRERYAAQLNERIARKEFIAPFLVLAYCGNPAVQLQGAENYVRHAVPVTPAPLRQGALPQKEKLGIAYLSADFHSHATTFLISELIELHDRTRFEVIGVSFGFDDGSAHRKRLVAGFDAFHDVRNKSDREIAQLLLDSQVDIAVDLKGHTQDARPGIFAFRGAPIQVQYLGYPGAMGAPFIDYTIADATVAPFEDQRFFSEKIAQLPDCYQVNDSKRVVAEGAVSRSDMGLPDGAFVFCCFNNNWKITPALFDIWMRLLGQVENSVLWLFKDNVFAERNLREEARRRGIDPARLVFADKLPLDRHLARHRLADLFLDTLPYNAHTTASDALWMGLPVLTCLGESFSGRVAASLLRAIGLPELVTTNLQDYESLGLRLASDPSLLKGIKEKLGRNRLTTPLFDTRRFARHIEAAYTTMYETRRQRGTDESFAVKPSHQAG